MCEKFRNTLSQFWKSIVFKSEGTKTIGWQWLEKSCICPYISNILYYQMHSYTDKKYRNQERKTQCYTVLKLKKKIRTTVIIIFLFKIIMIPSTLILFEGKYLWILPNKLHYLHTNAQHKYVPYLDFRNKNN